MSERDETTNPDVHIRVLGDDDLDRLMDEASRLADLAIVRDRLAGRILPDWLVECYRLLGGLSYDQWRMVQKLADQVRAEDAGRKVVSFDNLDRRVP